jgi:hypothetical protein
MPTALCGYEFTELHGSKPDTVVERHRNALLDPVAMAINRVRSPEEELT